MISAAELSHAIRGAFRLTRFDADGLEDFDRSIDGFWRSFFAAVIVGPLQLLLAFEVVGSMQLSESWLLGLFTYVVLWLAFPTLMLTVADRLDRRHRYVTFIVALNWSNLPQVLLLLLVYSPPVAALLPPDALQFIGSIALAYILVYEWFIAKTALDISSGKAAAIVALDSLVSIAIPFAASLGQQ